MSSHKPPANFYCDTVPCGAGRIVLKIPRERYRYDAGNVNSYTRNLGNNPQYVYLVGVAKFTQS